MGVLLDRYGIAPSFALYELSELDWEYLCSPHRSEAGEEGAWGDDIPKELERLQDE